jgi:hypothetical protein
MSSLQVAIALRDFGISLLNTMQPMATKHQSDCTILNSHDLSILPSDTVKQLSSKMVWDFDNAFGHEPSYITVN